MFVFILIVIKLKLHKLSDASDMVRVGGSW